MNRLDELLAEIVDLRHTASLLAWDERVCMPPRGAAVHGEMLATVRRLAHETFTSAEMGRLLDAARATLDTLPPDAEAFHKISVAARDFDKAVRVPPGYVAEQARVASAAHQAWRDAREHSDFTRFQPHLEKILALKRQYVEFFQPAEHPYDPLLDDFEPGARTADIRAMFAALRPRQIALIRAIRERAPIDDGFLYDAYPEREVLAFAERAITAFGFDWTRGRQDKSAHPFATAIGADDVRITTRYDARKPFETLFSTLHEAGHALYEQGVNPDWSRTLLRGGASLGVHESQSRLWENVIGRSKPFWDHFFPQLQDRFPTQLGAVTQERFYQGINKVTPSLIRVDADEVTYNLHVMLRVEMEIALLAGECDVRDAPEVWNARMQEYLGVTPDAAADGILQDMHWSIGLFGYFATYTIGNLLSVQLWDAFRTIEPDAERQIGGGDYSRLREWLRTEIHRHGRAYRPLDLVRRVTGTGIDTAPYLRYLERKYGELYGLDAPARPSEA